VQNRLFGICRGIAVSEKSGFVIGYAWYSPEDYDAIRALMVDGDSMPVTYAEWENVLVEVELQTAKKGHRALRVPLKSMEFAEWCESNNLVPDAKSRNAYASDIARHEKQNGE
jgi:hypothetical protein